MARKRAETYKHKDARSSPRARRRHVLFQQMLAIVQRVDTVNADGSFGGGDTQW